MMKGYCPKCGKVQYEHWGDAERALNAIASRHRETKQGGIYRCRHCHYFHITSWNFRKSKDLRTKHRKPKNKRQ